MSDLKIFEPLKNKENQRSYTGVCKLQCLCKYIIYLLKSYTCVHVEDGEAEGGREVADQGEHHDWPVARVDVTRDEQGAHEHQALDR